jgi:alcohol dehydrogenase class IV
VTAWTGFDVLTHAVESYVSPKAQPAADALALAAAAIVVRDLPAVLASESNAGARERLAWASTTMGYNLSTVGTCLPHRLDKAVCALHPEIPHAQAVACFYPAWAETSWPGCPDRFADLTALLDPGSASLSVTQRARDFARAVVDFARRLGLELCLSSWGVGVDELPLLIERVAGDIRVNPVAVEPAQLADHFRRAIERDAQTCG